MTVISLSFCIHYELSCSPLLSQCSKASSVVKSLLSSSKALAETKTQIHATVCPFIQTRGFMGSAKVLIYCKIDKMGKERTKLV